MKTQLTTLTIVLMLIAGFAFGQDFTFRVLVNKGENSLNSNGQWTPLKTGTTIQSNDKVKVGANAYLGLYHSTGRTLELTDAGEFLASDLEKKVSTSETSVAGKYANFVLSKMQGDDGSGHRLSVTGAVERATDDSSLKVMLPSSTDLYNPEAVIRWAEVEGNDDYTVTLKNMFDEVIMEKKTTGNKIKLDFNDPKLAQEKLVILSVKLTGDENVQSAEYGIKKLSEKEKTKITESLDALKKEIGDDSALDKLIFAAFFEDNNLMIDASTNYEYAIDLSPGVQDFQNAYDQFIQRNGFGN
jgi:hypothetical protein